MRPGAVWAAMRPMADEPGPPIHLDRLPAREAAERELSKTIYTENEPGWGQRAFNWLWDRLFTILDTAAFHTPGGWLGLLLLAIAVAGLLIALRLRLGALRPAARTQQQKFLFTNRPRTAAEHRAAATEHAAAARWNGAVQEQMRALVRSLEERALLVPRPGRTAGEAAVEAGRLLPGLTTELRAAAALFDTVTYGGQQASAADHRRLTQLDTTLRATRPDLMAHAGAAL